MTYTPTYQQAFRTGCRRHTKPGQYSIQIVRSSPRAVDLKRAYRAARKMVDGERVPFGTWLESFRVACAAR